jgi:DnaJ family protein A protein 2
MFFNFGGGGDFEDSFFGGGRGGGAGAPKKNVDSTRFYTILGVGKDASSEEIRKAYRKLAAKLHPDKEGGSQEKFQELQAAYEILSDPEKKQVYDKYGEEGLKEGMGAGGGADIFDLLMNRGGGGGGRKEKPKSKSKLYPLKITLEDVYCGANKYLEIKRYRICSTCTGSGSKDPKAETKCSGCKGQGRKTIVQRIAMGMIQQVVDCDECRGTGTKIAEKDKCKTCKGEKAVMETKAIEVHIDKGVNDGKRYTFAGESDEIPDVIPGDVLVEIQVDKHSKYLRKGADLVYKAEINLLQALTGYEFVLTHLDGRKVRLYNKPGEVVKPGYFKTCKELGLPFFEQPYKYGNLYLDFEFIFPTSVNESQKEALIKAFPSLVPKQVTVKCEENYLLTDYKKEEENSHHTGGKKEHKMEEDDEEMSSGTKNVQCANQ